MLSGKRQGELFAQPTRVESGLWAVAYERDGRMLAISRDHRFPTQDGAERFARREQYKWGKLPLRAVPEGELER